MCRRASKFELLAADVLDLIVTPPFVGMRLWGRFLGRNNLLPMNGELEGQRVTLRPARKSDRDLWMKVRATSRTFLEPWEPGWTAEATTKAAFSRYLRRAGEDWRDGVSYGFLSFTREHRRLVGGVSLSNVRRGAIQAAALGYWVGVTDAHRGMTSEAASLVLGFAFDLLNLHRVEAACLPDNVPSLRLLDRLGFQREGVARGYLFIDGTWRDHTVLSLLREEWDVRRREIGNRPLIRR